MKAIKTNIKTVTYDIGEGFLVDIVTGFDEYSNIWLYHKDYGVKEMAFGVPETPEKTLELFLNQSGEGEENPYITEYKENYFDNYIPEETSHDQD